MTLQYRSGLDASEVHKRLEAASKLLSETSTSNEKFRALATLIKGIDKRLDKELDKGHQLLSDLEKMESGQVIELTVEYLPEFTEKDKERKKRFLLFIRSWKQLQSEVERIRNEFNQMQQNQNQSLSEKAQTTGKIITFAKGPFGLITIAAIILVVVSFTLFDKPSNDLQVVDSSTRPTVQKFSIQAIVVDDKKIPLSEVRVGQGPECGSAENPLEHYHAINGTAAKATDGTLVPDPGGCGYGKVAEVAIIDIE